jgi:trehalose/maltose hydrolase-like predicted phosphorylase
MVAWAQDSGSTIHYGKRYVKDHISLQIVKSKYLRKHEDGWIKFFQNTKVKIPKPARLEFFIECECYHLIISDELHKSAKRHGVSIHYHIAPEV